MPPRKRSASKTRSSATKRAYTDNPGSSDASLSAAEEPRAETGGGAAFGRPRSTTARQAAPTRGTAKTAAPKKAAAKKTAAKKTTSEGTATKKTPARTSAGTKTAGPATRAAKTTSAKATRTRATRETNTRQGASAETTRTARARGTSNGHTNGRQVAAVPAGKTAQDYNEAKRALSALWEDVTKQTYSAFNNIAGRVEKNFNQARQSINEMDVRYALEKTGAKLKTVGKSGQHSVQQMARQAKLLYTMLKDAVAGRFKVPWATVSAATAALLYFISPIDLLPDFIPGAGLIDDALVIAMAISLARMDLKRYIDQNNLDATEYGLKS